MDKTLYVRTDIGTGDPIILLHGMFADGSQWQEIARLLSADFRVIVVDLLGHGLSPRPKNATYSDKEHVQALRSTLESLKATKDITVVGYSMGGAVALAYCSTYPDNIKQLYLISTPYYLQPEEMIPIQYASSLLITKATLGLFGSVEKLMNREKLANRIADFGNNSIKFHSMIGANDNKLDPKIISQNLDKLVSRFDFVGHLKKLKAPLTFYVGKKDVFVVQGQLDALRQYQPNIDIQRLDIIKIDHMLVQNLPNEISRLIRKNQPSLLHVGHDSGKGETLILLNGIESSSDYWQPILPSLQKGRRVIAIDLLGFGKSPKPLNIAYTFDDQVAWLERTIESLNLKRFTLIGHSLGALIAASYAAKHKTQVKQLILLSPVFIPKSGANNLILKRIHFIDKISEGSHIYSRNAKALGYKRMSQYLPLIRSVRNGVQHQNVINQMRSLSDMPITILYGDHDGLIDQKYLKQATARLDKAKLIKLKNSGHNFPFFNPSLTIENLADYQLVIKPRKRLIKPPKTFLQQLAILAAPLLVVKSLLYILAGLLLLSNFAAWTVTIGLCFYVFRIGYSTIRGAFSLKHENVSYFGYILLGVAGVFISYFLYKQPQLALKMAILIVCGLILFSGLSKLLVAICWTKSKPLRRKLLFRGTLMSLIGLSAIGGSIVSIRLVTVVIALTAILHGLQFGSYACGAIMLAYVRGFKVSS